MYIFFGGGGEMYSGMNRANFLILPEIYRLEEQEFQQMLIVWKVD